MSSEHHSQSECCYGLTVENLDLYQPFFLLVMLTIVCTCSVRIDLNLHLQQVHEPDVFLK